MAWASVLVEACVVAIVVKRAWVVNGKMKTGEGGGGCLSC